MRRNYYHRTPNAWLFSSGGHFVVVLLGGIAFLLLTLRLLAPGLFITLVAPAWQTGSAFLGATAAAVPLESRAVLINEREQLARENEMLRNNNAALAARAADLERLLGGRTEASAGVLAGVIARPPVSPYDVLVIDTGREAGIAVGDVVLGPGGMPIGAITEANAGNARATLFSQPGRITEGWLGETRIPVRLVGAGAGAFDAELPGVAGALVGDFVFVPGPGALPAGQVAALITDPSSPTVLLRIRPAVNPFSLTWVTVVPASL